MGRALILLAWSACYAPTVASGVPCDQACPGDQVCVEHVCREPGYVPPDAAIDAQVMLDADGDGLVDENDNCPTRANADQHDEDADTIGDRCDPCPHLAGTAVDSDADGVGDACDPQPLVGKQRLVLFDPFTSALPEWTLSGQVSLGSDQLIVAGNGDLDLAVATGELRIATGGTISAVSVATPHQLTIGFGYNASGHHYVELYDTGGASGVVKITEYDGTYSGLASTPYTGTVPLGAWSMRVDQSVTAQQIDFAATLAGTPYPELSASTSTAPMLASGNLLHSGISNLEMTYDYFVVIETLP